MGHYFSATSYITIINYDTYLKKKGDNPLIAPGPFHILVDVQSIGINFNKKGEKNFHDICILIENDCYNIKKKPNKQILLKSRFGIKQQAYKHML